MLNKSNTIVFLISRMFLTWSINHCMKSRQKSVNVGHFPLYQALLVSFVELFIPISNYRFNSILHSDSLSLKPYTQKHHLCFSRSPPQPVNPSIVPPQPLHPSIITPGIPSSMFNYLIFSCGFLSGS